MRGPSWPPGAHELMLADTIGVGVPAQVRRLVPALLAGLLGRELPGLVYKAGPFPVRTPAATPFPAGG